MVNGRSEVADVKKALQTEMEMVRVKIGELKSRLEEWERRGSRRISCWCVFELFIKVNVNRK